jgi:hypothetical protein
MYIKNYQILLLPDWYNANAIAPNIIAKNAIMGKVALFGSSKIALPHAYKKIAITSNTTNIKM